MVVVRIRAVIVVKVNIKQNHNPQNCRLKKDARYYTPFVGCRIPSNNTL